MVMTKDKDGWSILPVAANARRIYVSAAGKDANDGTTPEKAVKTLGKAVKLLDKTRQNAVYLRAGDTFNEAFGWLPCGGKSEDQPLIVTSYGSGPRPIIKPAKGEAIAGQGQSNIAVVDVHILNGGAGTYGIYFAFANNILIEGCRVEGFGNNITTQAPGKVMANVTIRRNVIVDSHSGKGHSQGIYAECVQGLTLEENIVDHNGWLGKDGATVFNHNSYIKDSCVPFVATGNVFANASSHGLQARGGGTVTDNVFIGNPLAVDYGYVNGGGKNAKGGVKGTFAGNVIFGGGNIGTEKRGQGLQVGNTSGVTVSGNYFLCDKSGGSFAAITLASGAGDYEADAVGINDTTISGNVVYKWAKALAVEGELKIGGKGKDSINRVTVSGNDFGGGVVQGGDKLGGVKAPATATYQPTADAVATADYSDWIKAARTQRKGDWRADRTAGYLIDKVRSAFTATASTPTPVSPPAPKCNGSCPVHCGGGK